MVGSRHPFVAFGSHPPDSRCMDPILAAQNMGSTKTAYTNVSVLTSWLGGMAAAARENGVGVLYCCAHPSVHMFGASVQAVV